MTTSPYPPDGADPFSGEAKVQFCKRLGDEWRDLADLFGVPPDERDRFPAGEEKRSLWEWIGRRNKLHELPGLLRGIGRSDLADDLLADKARRPERRPLGTPPPAHLHLNTLFFDLDEIRDRMTEEAERLERQRRSVENTASVVTPFVLNHHSPTVADRICEWLPYCYHGIAYKLKITLGPKLSSVERQVARVAQLRTELEHTDVACHIYGVEAPEPTIATFFKRVTAELRGARGHLVAVLTAAPGVQLSRTFVQLPAPTFRRVHVTRWAQRVVAECGWDPRLAATLAARVNEYALDEGDLLHITRTYEELDQSIKDLRADSEGFRRMLEEETGSG